MRMLRQAHAPHEYARFRIAHDIRKSLDVFPLRPGCLDEGFEVLR